MSSKLEECAAGVWARRESKGACILLKGCSLGAGIFLVLAGCIGFSAIAYGQLVYFIGSIYTVIFGLLVVARAPLQNLRIRATSAPSRPARLFWRRWSSLRTKCRWCRLRTTGSTRTSSF